MSQTATFEQCGATTTTTETTTAVICCSFRAEDTDAGCRGRWPPSFGPLVDHVVLVGAGEYGVVVIYRVHLNSIEQYKAA